MQQVQKDGYELQTVDWLLDAALAHACAGHHPDGMGGNSKKTAVVAAGVRKAHVEVPMVGRE